MLQLLTVLLDLVGFGCSRHGIVSAMGPGRSG